MMNMVLYHIELTLVALLLSTGISDALDCYECDNVAHPADCNRIVTCGQHEVCHVHQIRTRSGVIFYSSGCLPSNACPHSGKKRNSDLVTCTQCCAYDFCNKNQCDTTAPKVAVTRCLSCDDVEHPANCKVVRRCSQDSMCFTEENYRNVGSKRYVLGCRSKAACSVVTPQIFGRSLTKRNLCSRCCNTENCNGRLCDSGAPSANCVDHVHDCALLQTQKHICSDQTSAKSLCPKTCGLCQSTGSTHTGTGSICIDQSADCALISTFINICTDQNLLTRYGCYKNCGKCGLNGGWSSWGSYSGCSHTCGTGTQYRQRVCNNPTPSGTGQACPGSFIQTIHCNVANCPAVHPVVVNPVQPASRCGGGGWVEYDGLCYLIVKSRIQYGAALLHCRSLGGTIAEANTRSRNEFLKGLMKTDHYACKYCWLGAQKSHGHWTWRLSGHLSYTDWSSGEPDDKHGHEYCIEMGYQKDYHWNDIECTTTRNFICQK